MVDWCISEDEKKEVDPMFIKELQKCVASIQNWGEKIVYLFWYICTKLCNRNCLKQLSACYIIQTNSDLILFVNYIY